MSCIWLIYKIVMSQKQALMQMGQVSQQAKSQTIPYKFTWVQLMGPKVKQMPESHLLILWALDIRHVTYMKGSVGQKQQQCLDLDVDVVVVGVSWHTETCSLGADSTPFIWKLPMTVKIASANAASLSMHKLHGSAS